MRIMEAKIYAQNVSRGLEIYLDVSGTQQHLAMRRRNGLLYLWLRDGMTLGQLHRQKPNRNPTVQKKYHYSRYLLKLAETYIDYEMQLKKNQ